MRLKSKILLIIFIYNCVKEFFKNFKFCILSLYKINHKSAIYVIESMTNEILNYFCKL